MVPRTAVGAARGRYALARWVGAPPPSFEQLEKKWRGGLYGRSPVWREYNAGFDAARDPLRPDYLRAFFDHGLLRWLAAEDPDPLYWEDRAAAAHAYSLSQQGLRANGDEHRYKLWGGTRRFTSKMQRCGSREWTPHFELGSPID